MATELSFTSATELRRLIDEKRVSIVELVESFYQRIDGLNPKLNAYLALCPDQALAAAQAAQDAIQRGGQGLVGTEESKMAARKTLPTGLSGYNQHGIACLSVTLDPSFRSG